MTSDSEIIIIPFRDSGHIFPATELAKRLASRNHNVTLFLPSPPSSPIHPLIHVIRSPFQPRPPPPPTIPMPHHFPPDRSSGFREVLRERLKASTKPLCAILDVNMGHGLLDICREFNIPAISFYTASACSTALDHAARKLSTENVGARETILIPGLPEEMALTPADLRPHGPPPFPVNSTSSNFPRPPPPSGAPAFHGPPGALADTKDSVALIFNTCDELEGPFLRYIADEATKPVWGVGPLLPDQFWTSDSSLIHDDAVDVRPKAGGGISSADVLAFLDSKPPLSVLYVSFGSLNLPSRAELDELAAALESSSWPFIWAVQPSARLHDPAGIPLGTGAEPYYPAQLASRVGERGLVIRGWAPQLLILSHGNTGGFLTHCGWNSTLEGLACGVPMLTWPMHGDQIHNAKLVTKRLRVGVEVRSTGDRDVPVTKEDVSKGIEQVMTDHEMRKRTVSAKQMFTRGFPTSSLTSLDELIKLVSEK